jgi:hypothetical protein
MKKAILIFCTCLTTTAYTQARLVINNDAFVVIDNSAFVVLDNPATNAITQLGTGGRIVSESEFDRLKWNIGTSTGAYTMPWSTTAGVEFPLLVNITGAGTGAGNITFSTYRGGTWDNNTYRPSDVTHMLDYATGTINNSNNVIDRFWIVDPLGYGAKPSATFDLTYIDAEWSPAGNTITESDLGAQRFNTGAGLWGDYLPSGTVNIVSNIVSGIPVTAANFFRSWTLSEVSNPLPVELLSYNVNCDVASVKIEWTTASETDIQKFIITGSNDGINYTNLKDVSPSGTGSMTNYTEFVPNQYLYYGLNIVELSGAIYSQAVKTIDCNQEGSSATAYVNNGSIMVNVLLADADDVQFMVYDAAGKIIKAQHIGLNQNRSDVDLGKLSLAEGIYFLKVQSNKNKLVETIKIYYH